MERPNDRHYEIKSFLFYYIASAVIPKCELIAVQDAMEKLSVRFGALTEKESEDARRLLRNFGEEIEQMANERRLSFDCRLRAYRRGYNDGKKNV